VLVGPFVAVKRCYAPNSRAVRRASDHLPLVVDLEISAGEAAPA
jgi:endonuclease/exonuclease/phosphatase family metal-dependent hydrolase